MMQFASVALVAGAATLGDYVWYSMGVRHTVAAGLLHGVFLLTVVGGVLGAACGRVVKGLPIGAVAGFGGAVSYYVFVAIGDPRAYGPAIPAAWTVMWLLLAALDGRWLRSPEVRTWTAVIIRGLAAAVAAGVAFAVVRETLWGRPAGAERSYLLQFAAWAVAWAPGLMALMWERGRDPVARPGRTSSTSSATDTDASAVPGPGATDTSTISSIELLAAIDRGETLRVLDVRSEGEYAAGHVPGAVNVPFNQIPFRLADVPGTSDETLIVYCGHGPRAYIAGTALRSGGRARLVYMTGHFAAWEREGLRIER